ncbi:hypothetical protein P7C71_g4777, partial [Lecanoromycetidae sp. Uapishka_2]
MTSTSKDVVGHVDKKRKYDLDAFDDIVDIVVGPAKKVFKIHKEILCSASTYFRAALNGGFKEAEEQTVELPDDKVKVFKYFNTGSILARF